MASTRLNIGHSSARSPAYGSAQEQGQLGAEGEKKADILRRMAVEMFEKMVAAVDACDSADTTTTSDHADDRRPEREEKMTTSITSRTIQPQRLPHPSATPVNAMDAAFNIELIADDDLAAGLYVRLELACLVVALEHHDLDTGDKVLDMVLWEMSNLNPRNLRWKASTIAFLVGQASLRKDTLQRIDHMLFRWHLDSGRGGKHDEPSVQKYIELVMDVGEREMPSPDSTRHRQGKHLDR